MRIGVDLGGTKIEAAVLGADGTVVARRRVPTPANRADPANGYRATLDAIVALVVELDAEFGRFPAIGIGIPGSLSPKTGLVRNANSIQLNGEDFNRDLAAVLGRPVRLENDANCFALAEARAGAGRGKHCVFGVILGTGVGGGVVVGGEVLIGANRVAGEWGHNPLPNPGREEIPGQVCYCGRSGCIEAWCSGPGLAQDHLAEAGMALSPDEIAMMAAAGDAAAQDSLDRHLGRLARALATAVNLLDPDAIVLGGGLSNMAHLYRDLPKAMTPHVFSDCFSTPILQNRLGDSAGVIGAAWLWPAGERAG